MKTTKTTADKILEGKQDLKKIERTYKVLVRIYEHALYQMETEGSGLDIARVRLIVRKALEKGAKEKQATANLITNR